MVPYDNFTYQVVPTKKDSKQIFLDDGNIAEESKVYARARTSLEDEDCTEEGVVFAKSKCKSLH